MKFLSNILLATSLGKSVDWKTFTFPNCLINHRSTTITWWQGVSSPPENSKINLFDYQSSINHSGNFLRFKNIFILNSNRFEKSDFKSDFSLLLEFAGSLQLFVYNISQQSWRLYLPLNLPQQLMNLFQRQRQFFQWSSPPVKELTHAKPYNLWTTLQNAKKEARG